MLKIVTAFLLGLLPMNAWAVAVHDTLSVTGTGATSYSLTLSQVPSTALSVYNVYVLDPVRLVPLTPWQINQFVRQVDATSNNIGTCYFSANKVVLRDNLYSMPRHYNRVEIAYDALGTATSTWTPTRTPTASPTATSSFTATASASPTRSPTSTLTATRTASPTISPTFTASPIIIGTATFSITPTWTPSLTATRTWTQTATPTLTVTPNLSSTKTPTPTS